MNRDRHRRVKEIFLAVCDLPTAERTSHLRRVCAGDGDLLRQVEELLDFDRGGEKPENGRSGLDRIGDFRLLRKVGEGGMGEVWEAQQERPVRRRVALKLVKWGMDSKEVIARFESERQALAMMNHPNIARVFEAGGDNGGRPFFAMEYVEGIPLTEYGDSLRLDTRSRLALFLQVCDGVQHAHQKGIIHRDLKPSNILVAVEDDHPVPKIIDFGVAKATAQRLTERTLFTELGQWIGTPEYMSPEQAELTSLDVDTRSDVYSLGVVLYELLAGAQPFDAKELRAAGFDEMRRRIREDDPPRPSTRVSSLGEGSQLAADRRRTDIRGLARTLRGDLDLIVMKALEKDRTRRYGSPTELAEDVARYLRNDPVEACPPSAVYRLRKFGRRHRVGLAAAVVLSSAMVTGVVGTSVGLIRARRESETARAATTLLANVFADLDPGAPMGHASSMSAMLDRGVERVRLELADQPLMRARLLGVIGNAYRNLGRYDEARPLLEESLNLRELHLGTMDELVGHSCVSLGWNAYQQGRFDEALALFKRAADVLEANLGPDHPLVAASLGFVGNAYWRTGELGKGREVLERSLEIQAAGNDAKPMVVYTVYPLAMILMDTGAYGEAEALLTKTLQLYESKYGTDRTVVARLDAALGRCCLDTLRYDEARPLFERAIELYEEVFGPDHPDLWFPLTKLAMIDHREGDLDSAEERFRRALTIAERSLGTNHPDLGLILAPYSQVLLARGDGAGARAMAERALRTSLAGLGPRHLDVVAGHERLGLLAYASGDYDEALRQYRLAQDIREKIFGADHLTSGWNFYDQACILALAGDSDAALKTLRHALDCGWAHKRIFEDDDLDSLRGKPGYDAILEVVRARLESS